MLYINAKTSQGTETLDEFSTYKEAREMLKEYALCMPYEVYISSRSTKEWRDSE